MGSETGNPIAVDDAFAAPLRGLTVYGKSTQDGTPTPDAPVPIVSAGDGGSVAVKVRGKNLWDNFKTLSLGNVEQKKGTYIATTSTMQVDVTAASVGARPLRLKAGNTYTFSLKTTVSISNYKFVCLKYTNGEINNIIFANIDFVNFVPERDVENVGFILYESVAGDKVYDVQLEMGSKATSYEPYREQLLTLPTPNGLPGVPVPSGGNYTDQNGQQWVCDEVDFGKSVKVQRIDKGAFDATKTLAEQNAILATPIETPLTPAEITAYKALTTYAPDTVVQASDSAGVKLGYQKDVNLAINWKPTVNQLNKKANKSIISDAWQDGKTYAVGTYCIYNDNLYKAAVQTSAKPGNGSDWVQCNVTNELKAQGDTLNNAYVKAYFSSKLDKARPVTYPVLPYGGYLVIAYNYVSAAIFLVRGEGPVGFVFRISPASDRNLISCKCENAQLELTSTEEASATVSIIRLY